jgi:multidrug efflux pump subunit AcrA (membrane-fusion protein)
VKKDQVLATIDTPELDAQLKAAQAQLKASEAEVKVKEADVEFAKTTYDRWQGSPRGVVSEQEREDKKARYAVAITQLNAARARVALDRANVDRLSFLTELQAGDRTLRRRDHGSPRRYRRSGDRRQHDEHHPTLRDRSIGTDPGVTPTLIPLLTIKVIRRT